MANKDNVAQALDNNINIVEGIDESLQNLKEHAIESNADTAIIEDLNSLDAENKEVSEFIETETEKLQRFMSENALKTKEEKDTSFLTRLETMRADAIAEGADVEKIESIDESIQEVMDSYTLEVLMQRFSPDIQKELRKNSKKSTQLKNKVIRKLGGNQKYKFENPSGLVFALKKILPETHKRYTFLFLAHFYSYVLLAPMDKSALFVQKAINNIYHVSKVPVTEYNQKFIDNIVKVIDYILTSEKGV